MESCSPALCPASWAVAPRMSTGQGGEGRGMQDQRAQTYFKRKTASVKSLYKKTQVVRHTTDRAARNGAQS